MDLALKAYQRGCYETGCVPCMRLYAQGIWMTHCNSQPKQMNQIHLAFPWLMEGMIRGNIMCVGFLIRLYMDAQTRTSSAALIDYITKEWGDKEFHRVRKSNKKRLTNRCAVCFKTDSEEGIILEECGMCSYYSYCSKACQRIHWKDRNHCGECRQLQILRKYHKPYKREIRDSIKNGQDPRTITNLQLLRTKLGLTRPKKEYESLVERLSNSKIGNCNNHNNYNRNENSCCHFINPQQYAVARKDGTVHIGSTPEAI